MKKVCVLEVRDNEGKIKHIAISESIVAESDFTNTGTLTETGKTKYGLLSTDNAEIIGLETFDVNIDTKALVITAVDSCGMKWRYISPVHRWDKIDE